MRLPTPAEVTGSLEDNSLGSLEQDARSSPTIDFDPTLVEREQRKASRRTLLMRVGLGLLLFLIASSVLFIVIHRAGRNTPVRSGAFSDVHLPLGAVTRTLPITLASAPTLNVNGKLVVSNSVTLTPSAQPVAPSAGQFYYDKTSNQMLLYNGTQFVSLGGSSVQNTTNITNVLGAGGGTALSATGGTAGRLPKFNGAQALGNSVFTDTGSGGSVDGNFNLITVTSETQPTESLWPENPTPTNPDDLGDHNAVEVGVKIHADVSGFITKIRFYKGPTNTGTHIAHIWTSNGTSLGSVTFSGETASGWQEMTLPSPVAIAADTTYVVSYHTDVGQYAHDDHYFTSSGHDSGTLHALQDGSDGGDGVFKYSAAPTFPTGAFNGLNYWVDVVFQPNPPPSRYQVNGVQIASSDLANNADIAKRSTSQLFNGANVFRDAVASATAFSIQDPNGTALLTADTTSDQLVIGTVGGDVTGEILVLGNRTTAGDPGGAEGGTYYNRSQFMFRCYRDAVWEPCADLEVDSAFNLYDEFMGGQTSLSNPISTLGWMAQAIGANGSLSFNPSTPTPVADRPGVLDLQTPAVANQGTTLTLASSGGSMLLQKSDTIKTAVAIGDINNQVIRIGMHSETTGTAQPLSGVWWEIDPSLSNKWRFCYGDGTTVTCAASGAIFAANTWYRLEIRVRATGTNTSVVDYGINGTFTTVSNKTVDSTNRVSPALSCYTTTGAAEHCYWDYFQLKGTTGAFR
ncbi:MAG TPA: DUF4082 domain-containing protein [Candidatus Saccharimonadales bacterium]